MLTCLLSNMEMRKWEKRYTVYYSIRIYLFYTYIFIFLSNILLVIAAGKVSTFILVKYGGIVVCSYILNFIYLQGKHLYQICRATMIFFFWGEKIHAILELCSSDPLNSTSISRKCRTCNLQIPAGGMNYILYFCWMIISVSNLFILTSAVWPAKI